MLARTKTVTAESLADEIAALPGMLAPPEKSLALLEAEMALAKAREEREIAADAERRIIAAQRDDPNHSYVRESREASKVLRAADGRVRAARESLAKERVIHAAQCAQALSNCGAQIEGVGGVLVELLERYIRTLMKRADYDARNALAHPLRILGDAAYALSALNELERLFGRTPT